MIVGFFFISILVSPSTLSLILLVLVLVLPALLRRELLLRLTATSCSIRPRITSQNNTKFDLPGGTIELRRIPYALFIFTCSQTSSFIFHLMFFTLYLIDLFQILVHDCRILIFINSNILLKNNLQILFTFQNSSEHELHSVYYYGFFSKRVKRGFLIFPEILDPRHLAISCRVYLL